MLVQPALVLLQLCVPIWHSFRSLHAEPAAAKPAAQEQAWDPAELVHVCAQPPLPARHSSISAQVTPSPVYPTLQVQVNEPAVSVHVAFVWQPWLASRHSSRFSRHAAPCQPAVQLHDDDRRRPHPAAPH